jgi:hypothetical protein
LFVLIMVIPAQRLQIARIQKQRWITVTARLAPPAASREQIL